MYNILIVDDETMARETLKVLIKRKKLPYNIYEASNGGDAISIYKGRKIDFIFLDIKMPGLNGLEVGKIIKEYDRDALIIYLTAWDSFDFAKEAIHIGVEEYLLKPVIFEDVYKTFDKLNNIVDKRFAERDNDSRKMKSFINKFSRYFFSALKFDEVDNDTLYEYFNIKENQSIQSLAFIVGGLDKTNIDNFINNKIFQRTSLYYFESSDRYTFIVFSNDIDLLRNEITTSFVGFNYTIGIGIPFYTLPSIGYSIRQASIAYAIAKKELCNIHEYQIEDNQQITSQSVNTYLNEIEKYILNCDLIKARNIAHAFTDSLQLLNEQTVFYESILVLRHYLMSNIKFLKLPSFNKGKFHIMEAYLFDMINICIDDLNQDKIDKWKRSFLMIEDYIKANYSKNLSTANMAAMLDINEKYFSKLFKSYFSMKYIDFLTQTRMKNARKLLLEGMCVNKVSLLCGYNDPSYFSKVFAQYYQINPSECCNIK